MNKNRYISEFLEKVKTAKTAKSKEIRITIQEADGIASELLEHLLSNSETTKTVKSTDDQIVVDGGRF